MGVGVKASVKIGSMIFNLDSDLRIHIYGMNRDPLAYSIYRELLMDENWGYEMAQLTGINI